MSKIILTCSNISGTATLTYELDTTDKSIRILSNSNLGVINSNSIKLSNLDNEIEKENVNRNNRGFFKAIKEHLISIRVL